MKIKKFIGFCNCYLINDSVLIDAGADVKDKVDVVILTHCHVDHIAFLNKIVKKNKCKVYISEKEAKDLETSSVKTVQYMLPVELEPVKVDKKIKDGDVLKFKDFSLKVIASPGHTDGSISLYNKETNELFSGDTVFDFNGVYGRADLPSGSDKDVFKSVDKLRKLKVKKLYPGHD